MIGIVVVSHSLALGQAAVDLATAMTPGEAKPSIGIAAGLADQGDPPGSALGTDATAVLQAIESVDSPDGVLVLYDLGSALLSTELALEMLEPSVRERVRVSAAPFVEGLFAAVVTASGHADLATVAARAGEAGALKSQ